MLLFWRLRRVIDRSDPMAPTRATKPSLPIWFPPRRSSSRFAMDPMAIERENSIMPGSPIWLCLRSR